MKFAPSFLLFIGGILAISHALSAPADTLFYSYINSGKIVGKQWVWQKEKGDYYFYDEYNDRGRGPSLHTHITTGADGVILSAEIGYQWSIGGGGAGVKDAADHAKELNALQQRYEAGRAIPSM
jgi:hypothetical protein